MGAARSHDCGGVVPCRINSNVAQGQRRRPDLALKSVGTAKAPELFCAIVKRHGGKEAARIFSKIAADDFASSAMKASPNMAACVKGRAAQNKKIFETYAARGNPGCVNLTPQCSAMTSTGDCRPIVGAAQAARTRKYFADTSTNFARNGALWGAVILLKKNDRPGHGFTKI